MRLLLATALLLALAAPAQAGSTADRFTRWTERAWPIAVERWGVPCPSSTVTVKPQRLRTPLGDPVAYADWFYTSDDTPAWYRVCVIVIDTRQRGLTWPGFCDVFLHEVGHLATGPDHSDRPRDIMNEYPTGYINRPCRARR